MGKASRRKRERHLHLGFADKDWPVQHEEGSKISPCLIELIDPYIDDATTIDELKLIVAAGTIAWNLAAIPEPYRSDELEELVAPLGEEAAFLFATLIPELVERKLDLFPEDGRRITGWDVRKKNGQPYITVSAVAGVPAGILVENRVNARPE
ncbi:hypothetical protein GCM10027343_18320 [Noviherbaspirillum agri]